MSDAPPESMREAARSGGRWSVLESFGSQIVATVMTLILARLLAQEDFGIIAIVTVVTNALALVTQFGLSASLIQRDDITDEDRSTMFWVSLGIGVGLAGLGIAFATPLASTFGGERAAPFLAVAVLAMPFNLVGTVFRAVLVRDLRFRPLAVSSTLGTLGQAVIAVGLAAAFDAGAWAIILGKVFRAAFVCLAWAVSAHWTPGRRLAWGRFKEHFSFNAGWAAGAIAAAAVKNVDYIVVSHTLGEAAVGVYYVAYVLPDLVRLRVLSVFRTALFPILSRLKAERDRFAGAYLDVVRVVALVAFPAMVGLALVAEPVTEVAFGNKFLGAAAPMAFVAVAAGFDAMWQVVATALGADGTPGRAFWIVLIRLIVLVAGLVVLVPSLELLGAGYAVLAASVAAALFGMLQAARQFGIGIGRLMGSLTPVIVPTLGMTAAVMAVSKSLPAVGPPALVLLAVLPIVGATVYFALLWVAHRSTFRMLLGEVKGFVRPGA